MTPAVATVVGVDLDDIDCYHAIHGLPAPDPALRGIALRRWLPRFVALFGELGVHATFFVIGRDVEHDPGSLRAARAEGHELAHHGWAHAYDLVRWSEPQLREDLRRGDAALRELGATPEGFRAPGYTHDARLLRAVADLGYRYDSSALPAPAYWLAKVSVIAAMRLVGRHSASMVRGARTFFGPRRPHRRDDVGLWSLPISVTPWLRVPILGRSLLASALSPSVARAARRLPFLNLELHAIDLADPEPDGLSPELVRRQPELQVPFALRRSRLRALLLARGAAHPLRDAIA